MQLLINPAATASPGYSVRTRDTVTSGDHLKARIETLVNLIDGVSQENFHSGGTFSGESIILRAKTYPVAHDWRDNVRKLAMLARLQNGWDYPDSQPLSQGAHANYLDWLPVVPLHRMGDAEPLLTDDGNIRLEWRHDGYVRIAEIGPDSLYLAVLAPDSANDDAKEFDRCDLDALSRFFIEGVIQS